jgi:hypothetical protein
MDASTADVRGKSVDQGLTEGDPLPSLTDADAAFVSALRSALASDPGAASRPGQLRHKVEAALGPDEAARLRPLVHQTVAAAEENLPGYLTRIMPLTSESLQQLSDELATARGWNDATAQRVTQIWAHALGFSGVADGWPQGARPTPGPAATPVTGRAPVPDGLTALPPAAAAVEASPWPPPRRALARRHRTSATGEPVLGVVRAYAGMSLRLYVGIVAALIVLIIALFAVFHLVAGAIPILLIAFFLRRALADGALLATASGVEFTPYSALGSRPRSDGHVSASWVDVKVTDGAFSVLETADSHFQIGPLGRQFTRASLAYAGRGA